MILQKDIKKIRNLIQNGSITEAMKTCISLLDEDEKNYNFFMLQMYRLSAIDREGNLGVISTHENRIERNKITNTLLESLTAIQNEMPEDNENIYFLKGTEYHKAGDIKKAMSFFETAIRLNHNHFHAHLSIANILYETSKYSKLIGRLSQVLAEKSAEGEWSTELGLGYYIRAQAYLKMNLLKEACFDCRMARLMNYQGVDDNFFNFCESKSFFT